MSTITSGIDTTSNRDLMKAGILRKIFDDTDTEALTFYKPLVNVIKTTEEWNRDQRYAGLTGFTPLAEGQNIPLQQPVVGQQRTYTLARYGTGFRVTAWVEKYNKFDLVKRLTRSLKKVMIESEDIEIHRMFNNPTATTYAAGFDTLSLANNTHTGLLDGSTADNYDNLLNVAPSYTALASAKYYFDTLVNDVGMLMGMEPDLLVYHPVLWPTIQEILTSDNLAFEMSNTKSPWKNWIKPYMDKRLTSTTSWFVLSKKDDNFDLNVFIGQEPNFVMKAAADNTMDKVALSECHFTYGFGTPKAYLLGQA